MYSGGTGETTNRAAGSMGSSNDLVWRSHNAAARISQILIAPLEDEYAKMLHDVGWKRAAVMTSVSSSMFGGLMSTMLKL